MLLGAFAPAAFLCLLHPTCMAPLFLQACPVPASMLYTCACPSGQLGASVLPHYDPERTTHVIAMHREQPEVQQAMAQGKQVANVDWFYACCEQRKRLPILEVGCSCSGGADLLHGLFDDADNIQNARMRGKGYIAAAAERAQLS